VRAKIIPARNLQQIVRATPVGAVQPKHDRVFLCGVVSRRDEKPVLHRLAAGTVVAACKESIRGAGLLRLRAKCPEGQQEQEQKA
jgi:hypothetical protein